MSGSAYALPSKRPAIVFTLLEAALIRPSPMSFTVRARRASTRGWAQTDGTLSGRRCLAASLLAKRMISAA